MIAVALILGPIVCYVIWRLLRAADDDRTGWDRVGPAGATGPYSWGGDEELYRDLELRARELAR